MSYEKDASVPWIHVDVPEFFSIRGATLASTSIDACGFLY
jgi:hypothetical protein